MSASERKPDDPALDAPWLAAVRTRLDASARDLDAATLSRLNRARQTALAAARARPVAWWSTPWRFGAMAAAALALAVGLALILPDTREPDAAPIAAGLDPVDFDLLAAPDDLALYEDMEFYAWLDETAVLDG